MKFFILKIAVCLLFFSCGEDYENNHVNYEEANDITKVDTIEKLDEVIELIDDPSQVIIMDTNEFWLNSDIVRAELYFYAASSHEKIIDRNGDWSKVIVHKYDTILSSEELKTLLRMLTHVTNYMDYSSDCFEPHHAIVMKDKQDIIKAHFSICFSCNNYSSSERVHHIPISYFESLFKKYHFPLSREEIRDEVKDFFDKNPSLVTDSH